MSFQIAWSLDTPGVKHVTFSGHRTTCGLSVYEAKPVYESTPAEVSCRTCGAHLIFDMEPALKAAVKHVRAQPGTANWDDAAIYDFAHRVGELVGEVAWQVKRDHGRWNSNHVLSEFMAGGGWMTDKSPEARLIGTTALAVLEVLTESN
ncbi:hypothetical protein AB0L74_10175 [Streptomyces sp. NPDC052020]|uniref:hypothetical protein n=1 Tax=Streptomyces sp. NPDC052020 TaxID=3155677 RepID=UPI003444B2EA